MDIKGFFQKVDRNKLNQAVSSGDPNELKKVLEEQDIVLTEEQLDYVAGGYNFNDYSEPESE